MKNVFSLLALATLLLMAARAPLSRSEANQGGIAKGDRAPVLVELFTSEGCSSCPPADALLSKLETLQPVEGAEIIALEEHVDYWNHDGWVDPYSDAQWTSRQQEYVDKFKGNSPYTPQMIVDGQVQFVGNNGREALQAIRQDTLLPKTKISLSLEGTGKKDAKQVEVRVGNPAGPEAQRPADVWIAVTEQGLGSSVSAGENAGKEVRHAAVVRFLHKLGTLSARNSSAFDVREQVKLKSSWKPENLRIVVFVQDRKSLHILGAAEARLVG